MRKFTKTLKAAIRNYYDRRGQKFRAQAKPECLSMISEARQHRHPRSVGIVSFQACAGTFWFGWSDGAVTIHNEQDWWRMKRWRPGAAVAGR